MGTTRTHLAALAAAGILVVAACTSDDPGSEEAAAAEAPLCAEGPGTEVDLQIYRGKERRTVRVKLGERPLDAPRAG